MKEYIWLFPIIFIFHDMEEIIGTKVWLNKNSGLINRKYPRLRKISKNFSTEGFAVAVFEELIICLLICTATSLVNNQIVWGIWLGAFMACALHFVGHIIQAMIFKKYIPAVATSSLCIPASVWIIFKVLSQFSNHVVELYPYMTIGLLLVFVNLILSYKLMGVFTRYINKIF